MAAYRFEQGARLVVKVGSALLVDDNNQLNLEWLYGLAADVAALRQAGHEVLIVSSGAIAIGCAILGIERRRAGLPDLQAAAAAGQVQLVHAYQEALGVHAVKAAQILLTPGDTEHRRRFLNARATLAKLLARDVVPVINENDTVATDEIRYGDNDRLAARVSQLVMANTLVLLSDVDGLYDRDPTQHADANHIAAVDKIDAAIVAAASGARSALGSGGMTTKVLAARIATLAGCSTVITRGSATRPLTALTTGARHTLFRAQGTPASARKQWLAGVLEARGAVQLDSGAAAALLAGNSLLPVGITAVSGNFQRGDVVRLLDSAGTEIGRGLAEYASDEAAKLAGQQSAAIEQLLGYRGRAVLVHRDELVLFDHDG